MSDQLESSAKRQKTVEVTKSIEGNAVLPAEMFDLVIEHMDLSERMVCRVVCRNFKQVVDRLQVRSLVIAENKDSICKPVLKSDYSDYSYADMGEYYRFSDRFYFVTNDPVYESHSLIGSDTAASLRAVLNCLNLCQLRRLFIVEAPNGRCHVDLLNRLVQLEHLQISSIDMDCNLSLRLPALQTLSIAKISNHRDNYTLSLATPNLQHFETRNLMGSKIRFEHPKSVTLLQVEQFDEIIRQLVNLETLICNRVDSLVRFEDDDEDESDYEDESDEKDQRRVLNLSVFPKLKRLDCAHMLPGEFRKLFYQCQNRLIDFYFCGLKIENPEADLSDEMETEKDEFLRLPDGECLYSNYDRLSDALYFCEGIRWAYFRNYFPDRLPPNFARKFYCVTNLFGKHRIENVAYLIELLQCFKCLKRISLQRACLSQDFFDRHSYLFGRIQEFELKHDYQRKESELAKLDFKFILNFPYLERFETNQPIKMRLIGEAFNSLKYLREFWVLNDWFRRSWNNFAFGVRLTKNKYKLFCYGETRNCSNSEFSSKSEMIQFVEQHFPAVHLMGRD